MGLRLLMVLAAALATAAPAATAEPNATTQLQQLPEIVVTAQRIEQWIEDVPNSVSAFDGEFIGDIAARDLADLVPYAPGVRMVANDPGLPQLYIRGFGTNPFNPSFEGSVGFVQDDVYFGRPQYFNDALFDVERIEILRGAQGTLFGKNTTAGVVGVTSRQPTAQATGDARVTLGEQRARRIEGGGGGMFADWGGVRVSGLLRDEDGELFNTLLRRNEQELRQRAARVNLVLLPTTAMQTRLLAQTSSTRSAYWPFQLLGLDDDTRTYLQGFDPAVEDNPFDFRTSMDTPGTIERGSSTLALRNEWEGAAPMGLKVLNPVLILAGSRFHVEQLDDLDVSPADIARLDSREDHRQRSAELRVHGAADSLFGWGQGLSFVAGVYAYNARLDFIANLRSGGDLASYLLTPDALQLASGNAAARAPGDIGLPGLPLLGELGSLVIGDDRYQFDYTQDATSTAVFGHLTWQLAQRWALSAGARFNRERKRAHATGSGICPGKQAPLTRPCVLQWLVSAQDYDAPDLRRAESDLSPRLAVQYFFEAAQLYASYTRGYKSGGYNAISFTGDALAFDPETARAVELGVKGRARNGALRFGLAAHHTRFDDLQVLAFNGVFLDVSNAASATSLGLEADVQWVATRPWLSVAATAGLLDARYDNYRGAPAPVSQGIAAVQDLSGRRIAFAPRHTASLSPSIDVPLRALRLRVTADLLYQGDQFTDADLDPATRTRGQTRLDARATLATPGERWTLTLGGSNLGKQGTLNQVVDSAFFPGTYNAVQARGRHLFVALSARF